MSEEGIPPAPAQEVVGDDANQPSLEQDSGAKDEPGVDMPQTPATIQPGTEKKPEEKTDQPKKKRKRSVNPAHFRNKKKTKRNFWTQEEVDALLKGVEKIGPGKWTKIKGEYPEIFANRTSLDLKDKWRNIERRPDTNKIAKVSRAKKQADAEAKGSSGDGLEPLILTVECEDGPADGEKTADNVTAANSQTNDLYGWAISKFYPSLEKSDIKKISLLTQEGNLIPYNKSLKAANLVNNTRLKVVKKSHADVKKERSTAEI